MKAKGAQAKESSKPPSDLPASDSADAETPAERPETATTVMMRNVPNRYTAEELLAEVIVEGFQGCINLFYLRTDSSIKRKRGSGFINALDPQLAKRFVDAFDGRQLTRYSTQKIWVLSPASTQGYDANVAHYLQQDAQRMQNPWFCAPLHRDGRH